MGNVVHYSSYSEIGEEQASSDVAIVHDERDFSGDVMVYLNIEPSENGVYFRVVIRVVLELEHPDMRED